MALDGIVKSECHTSGCDAQHMACPSAAVNVELTTKSKARRWRRIRSAFQAGAACAQHGPPGLVKQGQVAQAEYCVMAESSSSSSVSSERGIAPQGERGPVLVAGGSRPRMDSGGMKDITSELACAGTLGHDGNRAERKAHELQPVVHLFVQPP